jgi:hypothetical protein
MKLADTVITTKPDTARDKHLWIVCSDPAKNSEEVLILNLTTDPIFDDRSCVLHRGDHPFVRRDCYINYAEGYLQSDAFLNKKITDKVIELREPMSSAVMQRIWYGASVSDHIPFDHRQILVEQQLIQDCEN